MHVRFLSDFDKLNIYSTFLLISQICRHAIIEYLVATSLGFSMDVQ